MRHDAHRQKESKCMKSYLIHFIFSVIFPRRDYRTFYCDCVFTQTANTRRTREMSSVVLHCYLISADTDFFVIFISIRNIRLKIATCFF